jgi:hypothetical protein
MTNRTIVCTLAVAASLALGFSFPTDGCWQITGRVGAASLTFVVLMAN